MYRLPLFLLVLWSALLVARMGAVAQVPAEPKPAPAAPKVDTDTEGRFMERLGRGVVAIPKDNGSVFVSWRLLGDDPVKTAFNVYRKEGEKAAIRLNERPLGYETCFVDELANLDRPSAYFVRAVVGGVEQPPSEPFKLRANPPIRSYLRVPLQTLPGHTPNDASVGDLDGDGEYEIILKQEMRPRDNSQRGATGETKLEAYKLDGTMLWRINLGKNIREGAHYTPFIVYDLDGDGKAEVACRTADGTVDGEGKVIGDPNADHRNSVGYVLDGPEFMTIFDGQTGRALVTGDYVPARGRPADWGDDYGNRVDRFLAAVGYFDGRRPTLVMCRGYYTRTVLAAWNWHKGVLTRAWLFDSDDGGRGHRAYRGQGNHNLAVGDVDNDGKDEIVYGACCIDDDGRGLYSTRLGHGDAIHLADIDPDRPGLEVFDIHERAEHPNGAELHVAHSGQVIWGKPSDDVVRGMTMDLDPRHRGYESWALGDGLEGLWNAKGETISPTHPRSCNFGVWWDGDLMRELLDRITISKWDWENGEESVLLRAEDCSSNNGSKGTPCLCADLFGDWREEVIWRSSNNKELRIYTTTIPTTYRIPTLMHDPQYRLSVATQNVGYNMPTQVSYYLGNGMKPPPRAKIRTKPE